MAEVPPDLDSEWNNDAFDAWVSNERDSALARLAHNEAGRVVLFHATTHERAQSILAEGFRDGWLTGTTCVGVSLSLEPASVNLGAKGDVVLELEVPDGIELREYFVVEEDMPVWELLIPAEVANAWPRRLKGSYWDDLLDDA